MRCIRYINNITPDRTNQISALVATKIYIIIDNIIITFIVIVGVMIQNNHMHCTHMSYLMKYMHAVLIYYYYTCVRDQLLL